MRKFVSLSYFDLAELFRKSMISIHRNKPINLDISCVDPEGVQLWLRFFSWYHYKRAIIVPPAKRHLNGVSMTGRWGPITECWLGSFVVLQGIQTNIAKRPYIFVIFQGGGSGPPIPPLDSHMNLSVIKGSDRLIMLLITGCSILWFRGPPFGFSHIKFEWVDVVIYLTKCTMWRLLCYITSILKSRLNMCGALKTSICSFLGV